MGRHLAGRVTAVLGTHTHVQTNDASLWDGTAYLTDCGMTGPHDSVIGVRTEIALRRFLTQLPARSEPALGDVRLEGALVECDAESGRATRSRRSGGRRDALGALWPLLAALLSPVPGGRGPREGRDRPPAPVAAPRSRRPEPRRDAAAARARRDQAPLCASSTRPFAAARRATCSRSGSPTRSRCVRTGADRAAAPARRRARHRARPELRIKPAGCPPRPARPTPASPPRGRRSCGRKGRPAADAGGGPRYRPRLGLPAALDRPGRWFDPYDQHSSPFDEAPGHGTEVAEVVATMAPDVRILAARVFSDGGRSTTSAVHRVFEWVIDPDGDPRTGDAPSVVNGSWDDGGPGHCETEFDADLAAMRAAGMVPVFAAGNSGPGANTGASPASAPGAVAVGSVTAADSSRLLGARAPSCSMRSSRRSRPMARHRGRTARRRDGRPGHLVRRAAGDRSRRPADGNVPGRDAGGDHRRARARCARRRRARRRHRHRRRRPQRRAGRRPARRRRSCRPPREPPRALVERRGSPRSRALGTRARARRRHERRPHGNRLHLDARRPDLAVRPRRRSRSTPAPPASPARSRHVRCDACWMAATSSTPGPATRSATGAPCARSSCPPTGRRRRARQRLAPGQHVDAILHVRERGSGLVLLRYRVEVGGHPGRWRPLAPAARSTLTLQARQGRRALVRVRAVDLAGNETKAGFVLPR